MLVISLQISTEPDREVEDDLRTINNKYYTSLESVSFASPQMNQPLNRHLVVPAERRRWRRWFKHLVSSDIPTNIFFIINTHSQDGTGLNLTGHENHGMRHSLHLECIWDYADMQFLQGMMHILLRNWHGTPTMREFGPMVYNTSVFSREG